MKIYMKILKNINQVFLIDEILKFSFCPRLWHIIFINDYFKNQKEIFKSYYFDNRKRNYLKIFGFFMIFIGLINLIFKCV